MGHSSNVRLFESVGYLCVAVALGCLIAGFGIAIPTIENGSELIDANLAKALGQVVALRLGLVLLVACVIVAAVAYRWTQSRTASTAALIATGLAGLDRIVLSPRVYEAWSRVDLVAGRPLDRLEEATQLAQWHHLTLMATGLAMLGVVLMAQALRRIKASASPSGTATPNHTVQNRERVPA